MEAVTGILIFIAGVLFGAAIVWFIKKQDSANLEGIEKQFENVFGNLSRKALSENQKSFLELANSQFESLVKKSEEQLGTKGKLIDVSLQNLNSKLEGLTNRTNELRGKLEESSQGIGRLTDTTSQLRQILSSSQQRGHWGERMVEDILGFIGLAEGINFVKQTGDGNGRPDFTFKLPQNKIVNMDVKFPLAHYEKYVNEQSPAEMDKEKDLFLKDVKNHIITIEKRNYADPAKGSVDYVLMFIPNESIYYFINKEDNNIIDFALKRKIILCSPVTLYAVLSLIHQAVSNFAMEEKAGVIQKHVIEFRSQWIKFVEKMESVGKSIGLAQKSYEELSTTRVRQLEKPMEKIAEMQMGIVEIEGK